MKSLFDFIFALSLFIFILPLFFILCFLVKLSSRGPIFHWSKRIGQNNIIFYMPKFRSMNINTPHVATDLLTNPHLHVTTIGSFLRKTSLDELPQLFCIINGSTTVFMADEINSDYQAYLAWVAEGNEATEWNPE